MWRRTSHQITREQWSSAGFVIFVITVVFDAKTWNFPSLFEANSAPWDSFSTVQVGGAGAIQTRLKCSKKCVWSTPSTHPSQDTLMFFSDEPHFHLTGCVIKQNKRYWAALKDLKINIGEEKVNIQINILENWETAEFGSTSVLTMGGSLTGYDFYNDVRHNFKCVTFV